MGKLQLPFLLSTGILSTYEKEKLYLLLGQVLIQLHKLITFASDILSEILKQVLSKLIAQESGLSMYQLSQINLLVNVK